MALTDLNPGHIVGRPVLLPLRNFYNYNLQFTNFNYNYKKIPVSKRDHRVKKKKVINISTTLKRDFKKCFLWSMRPPNL